jgi:glycosyltransferase involved in cell wall biosynthesis
VASAIAPLRELGGDAVLYVDPLAVDAIADAVAQVWTDPVAAGALVAAGHGRARHLGWDTVGRAYRALYREVAQRPCGVTR